jgi:hypothetical protein
MFRTSYVHLQEDYIVHAALYGMFFMHLCKQSGRFEDVWLTLHKCITMHSTKNVNFIIHDLVGFTPNSRSHCYIRRNVQKKCIGIYFVLFYFK